MAAVHAGVGTDGGVQVEEADGVDGRAAATPDQVPSGEHAEQDAQRAVQGGRTNRAQGEEQLGGGREMVETGPQDLCVAIIIGVLCCTTEMIVLELANA